MGDLTKIGNEFAKKISAIKASDDSVRWYRYDSMANVHRLDALLPDEFKAALKRGGLKLIDIGAADGDLGYFLEQFGNKVDFLDNPPTNNNGLKGIKRLSEHLGSNGTIIERDIDGTFEIANEGFYDFAIALGILYHLRNPMAFLKSLALMSERMIISTKIATHADDGTDISHLPVAYLLDTHEANNDPTNYWVFTPVALRRALKRCGWKIVTEKIGGVEKPTPANKEKNSRMFAYCERDENWRRIVNQHA